MVAAVFGMILGFLLGSMAQDFGDDEYLYNPVRFYRQLKQLQSSPWLWLSPELAAQIRESRRELVAGAAAAALTGAAYCYGGPGAAVRTYDFTRTAFRLEHKAPARSSAQLRRPRSNAIGGNGPHCSSSQSSRQQLMMLETAPEEVD